MHYLHAGAARPVLLIHGLVGSSDNWRKNIGVLAQEASVYAIDLVNAGTSERIAGLNAQLDATADRVAAAMDALGIEKADIVGHSHGGAVALMLAARHPERVRSLILFAPANPFCSYPDPMIRFYSSLPGQLLGRCGPYLPRQIQLTALGRMYGDPKRIGQGCIDGYVAGLRVPGTVDHILAIVRGWFADMASLSAALPLVANVPTLIVWGDRDRAVSVASGKRLQRELPASEFAVVPGAGHVVFEELPVESNQLMLDWLRRDFAFDSRAPSDPDDVAARSEDRSRPVVVAVNSVPSAQMPQLQPRA
jgi:pimeloyl-ACP methyl ester carboxylesterase